MTTETARWNGNWYWPTSVRFGLGRYKELGPACQKLGLRRPFLLTDQGVVKAGHHNVLEDHLLDHGVKPTPFTQVPVDGDIDTVDRASRQAIDARVDAVIALGGGTVISTAKAVAVTAAGGRPFMDYLLRRAAPDAALPLLAVPTIAATGAEICAVLAVTDRLALVRRHLWHPTLMPSLVIADPELTATVPPALTVAGAIDVVAHALESLASPGFHPAAEAAAINALRMVIRHLPQVIEAPTEPNARAGLQAAALQGQLAADKGLGPVHALADVLTSQRPVHHGALVWALLPNVVARWPAQVYGRIDQAARAAGSRDGLDGLLDQLRGSAGSVGLAGSLSTLGATVDDPLALGRTAYRNSAEASRLGFEVDHFQAVLVDAAH